MTYPDYISIYERACERKGGEALLEALLPASPRNVQLAALGSDRYLAEFTRKIFQSGFVWRVVDNKWANFEEIFWGFDIERLLMMPDEMLERKAKDPGIIRNFNKVKTIPQNALMIDDVERREGQAFGEFIADWPEEDVIGLWLYLKKKGSRLGGNTGPYALRSIGGAAQCFGKHRGDGNIAFGDVDGGSKCADFGFIIIHIRRCLSQ